MKESKEEIIEAVEITHETVSEDVQERPSESRALVDQQSAAIIAASSYDDKIRAAEGMIDGGLVPESFARDPGAVISAVEMGMELGLGPWASLNNIVVIQRRATLSLNAMLSLARSKGVLINVIKDHELVPIEVKTKDGIKKSHDRATTVEITRGEDIYSPSGKLLDSRISTYTFTKYWSEAVRAELTTKDNWKRMPKNMLRARAISEGLRLYAADILLGMYESTELGDANDIVIDLDRK